MPNVHRSNPVQFRPPADDREWLLARAEATGLPVNAILTQALREYREKTAREAARPEAAQS